MAPRSSRAAVLVAVLVLPVVFFLHGCGGDEDGSEPETTTTAEPQSTTNTALQPSRRLGSFMVIGDWGWDPLVHGHIRSRACQQAIADAMGAKARELGDVKFVVNVGDSFYPDGVANRSDPQWDSKWRNVYPPEVMSVPWYSIYGNHDYHKDPCACSENITDCAQVNGNISDLSFFYMPDTSWFREHPELGLEVIALDMNYYTWVNHTCQWTPCEAQCQKNLKVRMDKGFELFYRRTRESQARNLVIFSHYPTDYFWGFPDFLAELSNDTRHHIEYFGGHRHNVDQRSCTSTAPNNNWLVGGGGGWGCEPHYGQEQGFLVGEIGTNTIHSYPVLVNYSLCC